jgi:hypothetical protein
MNNRDRNGDKRRTDSHPASDQTANDRAIQEGLVTDEGVNEDRSGAHGPTLEEGEQAPKRGTSDMQRSSFRPGGSN